MKSKLLLFIHLIFLSTAFIYGQTKKIKIASFNSDTSYDYNILNNSPSGFSSDLIKSIMDNLSYPYELVTYTTNKNIENNSEKLDEALLNCDLAMTITSVQNNQYVYSLPYAFLTYDILTRDTIGFNGIESLKNKAVIVKRGSTSQNRLEELGENYFSYIIYVNDTHSGIKLLKEGVGDYLVCEEIASKNLSQLKASNNISTYQSNFSPLEVCFVSKDGTLINEINNALGKIKSNGTYDILYNKWFGVKIDKPRKWYISLILGIIGVVIIILLSSIYILKRLVTKATNQSKRSYDKIAELNQSISLLIRNGKIEVFMYDLQEMALYTLHEGEFIKNSIRIDELLDNIHPTDRKKYYDEYYNFIDGKIDIITLRIRFFDKDKDKYLYYEYIVKPLIKDYNNKVTRFIYSRKDETSKLEKIETQAELIQSLNLALRSSKLARWEYNITNNIIKLYRDDAPEIIINRNKIHEYIHPSDRIAFDNYIQKALFLNEINTIILKLKSQDNNTYIPCEISALIKYDETNKPVAIYGIIKNISEIKLFQQKIFELQYNMQLALEAGDMSAWKYDRFEQEYTILQGPTLNDGKMTKDEYLAFTHPEDRTILPQAIEKIFNKETDRITVTFRMNTNGRGWKWYACSIMAVPSDEEIRYIIGTRKDITQEIEDKDLLRKTNQELERSYNEIEKSQERLKLILDKLPIPIYIKDPDKQKHIYINNEAQRLYFAKSDSTAFELIIEEDASRCEVTDKKILETGEDYISNEILHFKSGRVMNTYVKKIVVDISGKKMILAVRTDLTEQHKYQLTSKILSKALPLLKAYTWSFTTRDYSLNFGETFIQTQRKYSDINSVEKFISVIHPEDRGKCEEIIKSYLKSGTGEYTFQYRMDLLEKGVYEWWESKSVVETIQDKAGTYLLVYGFEININDKVMAEAVCEA